MTALTLFAWLALCTGIGASLNWVFRAGHEADFGPLSHFHQYAKKLGART